MTQLVFSFFCSSSFAHTLLLHTTLRSYNPPGLGDTRNLSFLHDIHAQSYNEYTRSHHNAKQTKQQQSITRGWQTTSRRTRSGSRTWVGTSIPTMTLSISTVSSTFPFPLYSSLLPFDHLKRWSKSLVEVWYVDLCVSLLETIGNMFDFGTQSDYYEFVHGSDLFYFFF